MVKHNTVSYIDTKWPTVVAKLRRLVSDRSEIVKAEFDHTLQLGHQLQLKVTWRHLLKIEKQLSSSRKCTFILQYVTKISSPFVPKILRQSGFSTLNYFSYSCIPDSLDLIYKRSVWLGISKEYMVWSCTKCQKGKIFQHTKLSSGTFSEVGSRFAHIQVDFIVLQPSSDDNQFCMTITDRFTKWPEVIPTPTMASETTTPILVHDWISRVRSLFITATDQRIKFESTLLNKLTNILGCMLQNKLG